MVPEIPERVVRNLNPSTDEVVFNARLEPVELALTEDRVVNSKVFQFVFVKVQVNNRVLIFRLFRLFPG